MLRSTIRTVSARKLTGKEEALLVASACASPPEGCARWTLKLLAGAMVKLTSARTLLFAQRPLQIDLHEAPLGPIHGRATNAYAGRDIIVAGARMAESEEICSVEVEEK